MDRTFVYKISENSLELIFDFDEWKIFERQELGKTWTAIFAELGLNLISGFKKLQFKADKLKESKVTNLRPSRVKVGIVEHPESMDHRLNFYYTEYHKLHRVIYQDL